MSLAFLFPGQGSQCLGMGSNLFERFPSHISEANETIGYPIEELCENGPEEKLAKTQYTQPALYVVSYLSALAQIEDGVEPLMCAGHSVGEFAALAIGEAFGFVDGLKMVEKRGEIMSRVSGGGMAAVIGLEADGISSALSSHGLTKVDLVNFNSPGQIVISGPQNEVNSSLEPIKQAGAKLVVPLKVSGAFHSWMMTKPSEEFASFLNAFEFQLPKFPTYANVDSHPYSDPQLMASQLVRQMRSPVLWTQTISHMKEAGCEEFIECGPGKVLSKLLRQIP